MIESTKWWQTFLSLKLEPIKIVNGLAKKENKEAVAAAHKLKTSQSDSLQFFAKHSKKGTDVRKSSLDLGMYKESSISL